MRRLMSNQYAALLCIASLASLPAAQAEQHAIDPHVSTITVRVFKAGLFSALGHDHEIVAPLTAGSVNVTERAVELCVNAAGLKVRDPDVSEKDRAQIQTTMLGPEVLDTQHYSTIGFRATSAQGTGAGTWTVRGSLTLHGQTRPIAVDVRESGGHYTGSSRFKQTDFGITPIKVAGGAIRVKDEVRIEFDIQLAR
jgi:polyisoprenoid-binding protein YceI